MVRVKYRYVVLKVDRQNNDDRTISLADYSIYNCIVKNVQKYYGDFGVASVRSGLKCKYSNNQTGIAIVRVKHRLHRFVTSILPMASVLGQNLIKFRTLYNGTTIMQCNKFIVEYQKSYLDRRMSGVKSTLEREKLSKHILYFKMVE